MLCQLDELGILQRPALQGTIVTVYYTPGDASVPVQRGVQFVVDARDAILASEAFADR